MPPAAAQLAVGPVLGGGVNVSLVETDPRLVEADEDVLGEVVGAVVIPRDAPDVAPDFTVVEAHGLGESLFVFQWGAVLEFALAGLERRFP